MEPRLKLKYRVAKFFKKGSYRSRTGPKCCNANCGSTRKKSKKRVKRLETTQK